MRAVPNLVASDLGRLVDVTFTDEPLETAASEHVGALANENRPRVLVDGQRLKAGNDGGGWVSRHARRPPLDDSAHPLGVFRDGSAAASDDIDPARVHERAEHGRYVVGHVVIDSVLIRQTGVGNDSNGEP